MKVAQAFLPAVSQVLTCERDGGLALASVWDENVSATRSTLSQRCYSQNLLNRYTRPETPLRMTGTPKVPLACLN